MHTDPVFFPVARHGHPFFSEIPTVKQEDTKGDFVLNRRCQERDAEVDFRTKLVVELLKVWMFPQERIHVFMEACSCLLRGQQFPESL